MQGHPIVFTYKRNGKASGFNAEKSGWWSQRVSCTKDTETTIMFPVEDLKSRLRQMIKDKRVRIIKTKQAEGVAVPPELIGELLYGRELTKDDCRIPTC